MNILNYILPLAAALFYTLATLFVKRALSYGVGSTCIAFISNWIAVPVFLPILFLDSQVLDWSQWGWALVCGFTTFLGMLFTFIAVRVGDLSVQTPVMGTKVIFVGVFSFLLAAGPIPWEWWVGALLTVLGVYVLGRPISKTQAPQNLSLTIVISFLNAISFAICDVVMVKYAPLFGEGPFLVLTILVTAILSFGLIPFFEHPLKEIPKSSWLSIWGGGGLMALEGISLYIALAFFGNATAVNILFGARGIWTVLLVWLLGRAFIDNEETRSDKKVMLQRLMGAGLLFAAIVLVIISDTI